MASVDVYIEQVIGKGDQGSNLLRAITAPTLNNCEFVDLSPVGPILRIPEGYYCVVHSNAGDCVDDLEKHAASLVDRLVSNAMGRPLGFANVIDSRTGDTGMLERIAKAMVGKANEHGIAIMNGENAILGERVKEANVSGTMISIVPKKAWDKGLGVFVDNGVYYAIFDPMGKAVTINSDGVGTKTEFYERIERYTLGILDWIAMILDDTIKTGAIARVASGVVETRGDIPVKNILEALKGRLPRMGFIPILQPEDVGDRLNGYCECAPAYNISGSVVSIIDEERLRNPLKPGAGEYLIAIRKKNPNPRSNGITHKRKMMVELFGEHYQNTPEGKLFLDYLAEPSAILYPVFRDLIELGLATSVYHMSGGAFDGKLSKTLAQNGLFAVLSNLFKPDSRELFFMRASRTSVEDAYRKWPMGNDGFITSKYPFEAIELIGDRGFEARAVGRLIADGRKGIELEAFNGRRVHYWGG